MRYAESSSTEVQWITATLGIRELPDFHTDELIVTFTLDGSSDESEKIYNKMQNDLAFSFWEQSACFTKTNIGLYSIILNLNHGSLRDPSSSPPSIITRCPHSYTLVLNKSRGLLEYIRQQLTDSALRDDNIELYKHMNYLVTQIVAQLKQHIIGLFKNMFTRNICADIHISPEACIPSGKLQIKLTIEAMVNCAHKFFLFL